MADSKDAGGGEGAVIERLFAVIESRRGGDPARSYVAGLLQAGTAQIAKKLGEEAMETAIAALEEEPAAVVREGADLVFHLLVLLADAGATPADLYAELARREGVSGIDEKAARPGGQGADEQS